MMAVRSLMSFPTPVISLSVLPLEMTRAIIAKMKIQTKILSKAFPCARRWPSGPGTRSACFSSSSKAALKDGPGKMCPGRER
jgi:hypothetical protein